MWKLFGALRLREDTRELFKERYAAYNEHVRSHFQGKSYFMEINICDKHEGWEKLCTFIDEPIPDIPFPHKGKSSEK